MRLPATQLFDSSPSVRCLPPRGALGRRLRRLGLSVALVVAVGLVFWCVPVFAGVVHPVLGSFGPGGPGSGSFGAVQSVAVDQSDGTVYVFDAGAETIDKFNTAGEPEKFSGLESEPDPYAIHISGLGALGGFTQIAVDSSNGPAKGDIYFANYFSGEVLVYGEDGEPRGGLNSGAEAFGGAWAVLQCGVAVDPAGNVYVDVQFPGGHVDEFKPQASPPAEFPVSDAGYTSELTKLSSAPSFCNIATDAEGNVYTTGTEGGVTTKYAASQLHSSEVEEGGSVVDSETDGQTLAVDPAAGGDLYVDELGDIARFDSSGSLIERFARSGEGAISESYGIAVNATSKDVYVSSGKGTVEIFAPGYLAADTITGEPSGVTGTSATLEGEVNPEGTTLATCTFEYATEPSEPYAHSVPCATVPAGTSPVKVSALAAGLTANTLYHYRLVTTSQPNHTEPSHTVHGTGKTFTTLALAPTVNDQPATASYVTQLAATLNGVIDPQNAPAAYHFAYGTTRAYGSTAPVPDGELVPSTADRPVSEALSGLQAGTVYHYALVAIGPGGESTGPDQTFTTPPVPAPTVSTGAAGEVSVAAATFTGSIDPQGWETAYHFEYGTSTAYGSDWPTVPVALGGLEGQQSVSAYVERLLPGTVYHYRLVATNPGGTGYGPDQTFTTPEYPASVVQESPVLNTPIGVAPPKATTVTRSGGIGALTKAQKLANALRACRKDKKGKRAKCEKQAKTKYGSSTRVHERA
jgi:hypothetical protein